MQTFHRFVTEAAFLAACDAAGWPRDHQNRPVPPPDIALDVIGPWQDRPAWDGVTLTPGAIDGRWHVNAQWPPDTILPPAWSDAEVIPEQPFRMFATRDLPGRLAEFKGRYDAQKAKRTDDPKLVKRG